MDPIASSFATPFDNPLIPRFPIEIMLQDVRVHECWRGAATIELRANAQAPVYRLPVRDVVEGFYWRVSFVLPFGEVIHDYLSLREAPHA